MHESFYDVSLWLVWQSGFPAHVACMPACDPLGAVMLLMQEHHLAMVAKAAVQMPDKSIERSYSLRLEVFSREVV